MGLGDLWVGYVGHPFVSASQRAGYRPDVAAPRPAAGFPGHVRVDAEPVTMLNEAAITLYFACSEALTNAMKHAGATRVEVLLRAHRAGDGSSRWSTRSARELSVEDVLECLAKARRRRADPIR